MEEEVKIGKNEKIKAVLAFIFYCILMGIAGAMEVNM